VVKGEGGLTSRDKVYAGGDAVTGAATVILAAGAGKAAAFEIDKMLSGKK
jgi:glutamate synthase (NADPH/NADH) small chain